MRIVEKPSQTPRIYNPNHPEYWLTEQGKRNVSFESMLMGKGGVRV